jgi:hypothetical protein
MAILLRLSLVALCALLLLCGCTQAALPPPAVTVTTICTPLPTDQVTVLQLASPTETALSPPVVPVSSKRAPSRKGQALSPMQLVADAQKAARIEPTERSFYGTSAEVTYTYQPGKVFTVYLASTQATAISLPKGEALAVALYLDPEAYEVKNTRLGGEVSGYDVITVRPLKDSGEIETFALSESGKKFLLRLVVGKVAMLSVVFESPALAQDAQEPRLPLLPRPAPEEARHGR